MKIFLNKKTFWKGSVCTACRTFSQSISEYYLEIYFCIANSDAFMENYGKFWNFHSSLGTPRTPCLRNPKWKINILKWRKKTFTGVCSLPLIHTLVWVYIFPCDARHISEVTVKCAPWPWSDFLHPGAPLSENEDITLCMTTMSCTSSTSMNKCALQLNNQQLNSCNWYTDNR